MVISLVAQISTPFPFMAEQYSGVWILTFCFSLHQLIDTWVVSASQVLRIILANTHGRVFLWLHVFIYRLYIPRSRIPGSCGESMFNILGTAKLSSKATVPSDGLLSNV